MCFQLFLAWIIRIQFVVTLYSWARSSSDFSLFRISRTLCSSNLAVLDLDFAFAFQPYSAITLSKKWPMPRGAWAVVKQTETTASRLRRCFHYRPSRKHLHLLQHLRTQSRRFGETRVALRHGFSRRCSARTKLLCCQRCHRQTP